MGNFQTTETIKPTIMVINHENIVEIDNFGYPVMLSPYSTRTSISHDAELNTCLKNMVTMFGSEIHIEHDNHKIIDPIVIHDKKKLSNGVYKLTQLNHDFLQCSKEDMYVRYKLVFNDKHTYKFAHISNVQFYFETINHIFAK